MLCVPWMGPRTACSGRQNSLRRLGGVETVYRGTSLTRTPLLRRILHKPYRLETYGDPRRVGVSSERGTPVHNANHGHGSLGFWGRGTPVRVGVTGSAGWVFLMSRVGVFFEQGTPVRVGVTWSAGCRWWHDAMANRSCAAMKE